MTPFLAISLWCDTCGQSFNGFLWVCSRFREKFPLLVYRLERSTNMNEDSTMPFNDQEMSRVRISNLEATVKYLVSNQDKKEDYHKLEVAALNEQILGTFHLVVCIRMIFIYFIGFFTELTRSLRARENSRANMKTLLDSSFVAANNAPSFLVHGGTVNSFGLNN